AVVRRRRSELALYRILGFTPSQVRWTLLGQGALVASVAIVFGMTLGIAAGRTLWRLFATQLGVVPEPIQPARALVIAAVATLVTGVAAALGPAIAASRVPPAIGIRSE
ncbi:MAG: FtsX-like permease family protein, partial [Aquihabitans sp.]